MSSSLCSRFQNGRNWLMTFFWQSENKRMRLFFFSLSAARAFLTLSHTHTHELIRTKNGFPTTVFPFDRTAMRPYRLSPPIVLCRIRHLYHRHHTTTHSMCAMQLTRCFRLTLSLTSKNAFSSEFMLRKSLIANSQQNEMETTRFVCTSFTCRRIRLRALARWVARATQSSHFN